MKTTNSTQKTDNRQFEQSTLTAFALVISFVFISVGVSASEFQKTLPLNSSLAQMVSRIETQQTLAMIDYRLNSAKGSFAALNASKAFFLETSAEKSMEIETWMTNESNFITQMASLEVELEEPLSVEGWMLTNQNFLEITITTDSDQTLEVEDWMLDETICGK